MKAVTLGTSLILLVVLFPVFINLLPLPNQAYINAIDEFISNINYSTSLGAYIFPVSTFRSLLLVVIAFEANIFFFNIGRWLFGLFSGKLID